MFTFLFQHFKIFPTSFWSFLPQRQKELKNAEHDLKKAKSVLQMDELKCRKRVLRRLGYATSQDVIERKGRVACELSAADELLITEMLFNGLFNDLSGKEIMFVIFQW